MPRIKSLNNRWSNVLRTACEKLPAGTGRFVAWWTAIAVGWLLILPWIADQPPVHARLIELDARGIDPSAMFYTELPAMNEVLSHMNRFHREHPDALWNPQDPSVATGTRE